MIPEDLKDVFFVNHRWNMLERPRLISQNNILRQKPDLKPKPPEKRK